MRGKINRWRSKREQNEEKAKIKAPDKQDTEQAISKEHSPEDEIVGGGSHLLVGDDNDDDEGVAEETHEDDDAEDDGHDDGHDEGVLELGFLLVTKTDEGKK